MSDKKQSREPAAEKTNATPKKMASSIKALEKTLAAPATESSEPTSNRAKSSLPASETPSGEPTGATSKQMNSSLAALTQTLANATAKKTATAPQAENVYTTAPLTSSAADTPAKQRSRTVRPTALERKAESSSMKGMMNDQVMDLLKDAKAQEESMRDLTDLRQVRKEEEKEPQAKEDDEYAEEGDNESDTEEDSRNKFKVHSRARKEAKGRRYVATDPEVAKLQCKVCLFISVSADKLKKHMHSHDDKCQSICPICNKTIKYNYNLKGHMKKCSKGLVREFGKERLAQYYPKFFKQMKQYAANPTMPMPKLPPQYKMGKYGIITGHDERLPIEWDDFSRRKEESMNIGKRALFQYKMAPAYSTKYLAEKSQRPAEDIYADEAAEEADELDLDDPNFGFDLDFGPKYSDDDDDYDYDDGDDDQPEASTIRV